MRFNFIKKHQCLVISKSSKQIRQQLYLGENFDIFNLENVPKLKLKICEKNPGWMGEWVGGWLDGIESRFKDCLQQSKIISENLQTFYRIFMD